MKGSVFKRGTSWSFVVDIPRDEMNQRRQKKKGGFKTKKEAEAALAQMITEVERGIYTEPSKTKFGSFLNQWFEDKQKELRTSTIKGYEGLINHHIIPYLGNTELSKLSAPQIQKFYSILQSQEKPLANKTIRHIHNILHDSLDRALKWGLVPKNVVDAVDCPKVKRMQFNVWNEDEIRKFFEIAKSHKHYIAFHLAVTTGMRRGEILGLRWQDLDLEKGILSVRQTVNFAGRGYEFQIPKTDYSQRSIDLSPEDIEILKRHKEHQTTEKVKAGPVYTDYDLVVASSTGKPISNLGHHWQLLLNRSNEEYGIKKIRFHDIRHTHASLMLLHGINPKVVSERLGHSSVQFTLDVYSHVLPGIQKAAALQFANRIFNADVTNP